jgi:hypothetical protein
MNIENTNTEPTKCSIKAPADMFTGAVFSSKNCGEFEIVEYTSSACVLVRFLVTGYTTKTQSTHIRSGEVKDYYTPSIFGVGYIGGGDFKGSKNVTRSKAYITWRNMLERCYSNRSHEKHPTYVGCTVDPIWHNFQNFAAWFAENYIQGYELDKDIKVEGNKIYSPHTCLFVSIADNMEKAKAKTYKLVSPQGDEVEIYNLRKFARDNDLNCSCMQDVSKGRAKQHKGWRLA